MSESEKTESRNARERFMQEALTLARRGAGNVHPNPLVGAVIVAGGSIVGRGWHERCGGPHAEANAIADARKNGVSDFSEATLYVTLEPCCHTGRTPPCSDLVIPTGIGTVVAGMTDPNPRVSGRGFDALRAAGVTVIAPVLESECLETNRIFIKYVTTGRPYVLLKLAMTLDGKTALKTDENRNVWVSSVESRIETHRARSEMTAVMCGIGTVLADDPELNVRHIEGRDPVRIIIDGKFRIPADSKIARSARRQRTIVAGTVPAACADGDDARRRIAALERSGIEIMTIPAAINADARGEERIDLAILARELGRLGIDSVLLEGGATLAASAARAGIVDRVLFYIAPKIGDGISLRGIRARGSGVDIAVEGDIAGRADDGQTEGGYVYRNY